MCPIYNALSRARCPPISTVYFCRLGCELHRRKVPKYFMALSPIALGQMQTSQIFNSFVLSFCLNFLPALERDDQKVTVEEQDP